MRKLFMILLVLMLAAATLPVIAQQSLPVIAQQGAQQPLPITQVLLYKNGMAYIVRTGQMTTPMKLTFHPEDMNDILKSLTAWNPGTGALYSVGYTTGIPSSHLLSRFPFDLSGTDMGLGSFLVQMKGADVKLDASRNIDGKLLAVQAVEHATAPQTTSSDHRLTILMKDSSLQTVWLSDVKSVEFVDPQLRERLRAYLEVLSSGRQDVTREVSIYPASAPGPIQVAYLQQFPLWKTSYRVDLGQTQSKIQGWAQIDNPTGEAWENVSVSLISGAPVSFQMNLYDPLYTNRTTVAVPGAQVASPRQYESALKTEQEQIVTATGAPAVGRGGVGGGVAGGAGGRGRGGAPAPVAAPPPIAPPAPRSMAETVMQTADSMRVQDFYEYKFPFPVRLASRQSALLPFLQKTMNVERLSIFNARSDRSNPRLGARLENTTDIPFEPGPVTFFQDARYAGEAVLDYLPRGEKSLVSYGVDYDVQISNRQQQAQPDTTVRLTISKGVAVLFMESVLTTTYDVRNKGGDKKSLILEHPRVPNRTLKGGNAAGAFETTDGFYRFRMALDPRQATTLAVPEVIARQTSIALTSLTRPQLALFAGRETPANIREKLGQIVDLQEQIATLNADMQTTQGTIDTLFRDQDRLRENLKALKDGAEDQQMRSRYLGQLKSQEDRIDTARARIDMLNGEVVSTEKRLSDSISNLAFS